MAAFPQNAVIKIDIPAEAIIAMTAGLNAFNILDKNTNFKTSVSNQFISNSWDRLFERYYTISFEYKFNSQK